MTQQPVPPYPADDPALADDFDVDSILQDIDNTHLVLDDLEAKTDALDKKLDALLQGALKDAAPVTEERKGTMTVVEEGKAEAEVETEK
ncbi:hypothetical protein BC937DRAFT_86219 [Endogone sp. FLAS-F59071]|nr:hypothetical protein BC937DRAFT_86219 [Endogone sp. FLAS-F59071]|eukprot:RUS13176.1 hypothetical protein BC937DRAFT_86219 [Endogone sp. FLAS-F59071]